MTGTFKITLAYLKELGACRDGQRAFQKAFPDGGEYQEVLDRCAEGGRFDFGSWLLARIGPTEDTRTYENSINTPNSGIIFAGRVEFKSEVSAKFVISGGGIEAGLGIEAGEGIKAGWGIKAGGGFCVFAGLHVKRSDWALFATVSASVKPINLISGCWKPMEDHNEGTVS